MTREGAEMFMFGLKNYQWQQHPLLYKHVELGINMIYDDFESRVCIDCIFCNTEDPQRHLVKCKMFGIMVREEMSCTHFERK